MAKPRSLSLNGTQLFLLLTLSLILFSAAVLSANSALQHWHEQHPAFGSQQAQRETTRDSLDTMAKRLGQMQAQLLRLDTLGARLAKLSGMKPQEFSFDQLPAQGGPFLPSANGSEMTINNLDNLINQLAATLSDRSDKLVALETLLMQNSLSQGLLPSFAPVTDGWYSSNFGWRIDPFSGRQSMHEGVDFMVHEGTPIYASAGGVVVFADFHPEYGNMVEIDHGHDIVTRYAHASKLLTKVGALVRRGEKIAEVGSTGRSTGNHLHFEVRYKGMAQNPVRFLQKAPS